jgi:hypothetical protein
MELAGYLVNAVVLEHRPVAEVARAHGASRSWLYELLPGTERWARQPSCLARDGASPRPPGWKCQAGLAPLRSSNLAPPPDGGVGAERWGAVRPSEPLK